MICENPFTQHGARAYPCGACIACRIKRKSEWSTRLELESAHHVQSTFCTLTYRPDTLRFVEHIHPSTGELIRHATLIRKDLSDWLKRLRIAFHRSNSNASQIRFFACGEYGERLQRPHYHVILFGYPGCRYGKSRYDDGRTIDCCDSCDRIRDSWGLGIVQAEPLAAAHIRYTAGYVLKKMTSKNDTRLLGRAPEFSAMSLQNGGIGIGAVPELARRSAKQNYDVISMVPLKSGRKGLVGRYLKKKTRQHLGSPDGKAPDYVQADAQARMLPLLKAALTDKEALTLKAQIQKKSKGTLDAMKHRETIFNSRKKNETL